MRTPGPYTPEEAEQARAFLTEHASPIQRKLLENGDADDDGRQLYLIVDYFDAEEAAERHCEVGEAAMYVTANDELIVDYWRYLLTLPPEELRLHIEASLIDQLDGRPPGARFN